MTIVRAFLCLAPFPADFFGLFFFVFRILTPGASWRPKADRYMTLSILFFFPRLFAN